jgi:SAM-dependent methyltransferase
LPETDVGKSYQANSPAEQQAVYDEWAGNYEADLCAMGYRIPAVIASVFTRFVAAGTTPVLDAGCGGGIQAEPLAMLGYGPITGIDLSEGMLAIAEAKGFYAELRQMTLGEPLDFPDHTFGAVISSGTITPGHAPAHAFTELIRVAKSGAPIVFSLRDDPKQQPEYPQTLERLRADGAWQQVYRTPSFRSMPYGEPEVTHRVHVYSAGA